MRYTGPKEKIERRLGVKLFLKGERCLSQKCASVRRPFPPGIFGKHASGASSEYGRQLREKQIMRAIYGLTEQQCKNYIEEASRYQGTKDSGLVLFQLLERRLDNVLYRIGFASSRNVARQLVSHGHILVNGKRVTIPSYKVRIGDTIEVRPEIKNTPLFKDVKVLMKQRQPSSWLEKDEEKIHVKVIDFPKGDDIPPEFHPSIIFEFYAR